MNLLQKAHVGDVRFVAVADRFISVFFIMELLYKMENATQIKSDYFYSLPTCYA